MALGDRLREGVRIVPCENRVDVTIVQPLISTRMKLARVPQPNIYVSHVR